MFLATVSSDGNPHGSVLIYDVDDDLNFYFVTNKHSSKSKNIRGTEKVAFVVLSPSKDMTLQGGGLASEVKGERRLARIEMLLQKANTEIDGWAPISRYKAEDLALFKIETEWLSLLDIADMSQGELQFEKLK